MLGGRLTGGGSFAQPAGYVATHAEMIANQGEIPAGELWVVTADETQGGRAAGWWRTSAGWTFEAYRDSNVPGPAGPAGPQGVAGATGAEGAPGAVGLETIPLWRVRGDGVTMALDVAASAEAAYSPQGGLLAGSSAARPGYLSPSSYAAGADYTWTGPGPTLDGGASAQFSWAAASASETVVCGPIGNRATATAPGWVRVELVAQQQTASAGCVVGVRVRGIHDGDGIDGEFIHRFDLGVGTYTSINTMGPDPVWSDTDTAAVVQSATSRGGAGVQQIWRLAFAVPFLLPPSATEVAFVAEFIPLHAAARSAYVGEAQITIHAAEPSTTASDPWSPDVEQVERTIGWTGSRAVPSGVGLLIPRPAGAGVLATIGDGSTNLEIRQTAGDALEIGPVGGAGLVTHAAADWTTAEALPVVAWITGTHVELWLDGVRLGSAPQAMGPLTFVTVGNAAAVETVRAALIGSPYWQPNFELVKVADEATALAQLAHRFFLVAY